jgi:hypothetical protein
LYVLSTDDDADDDDDDDDADDDDDDDEGNGLSFLMLTASPSSSSHDRFFCDVGWTSTMMEALKRTGPFFFSVFSTAGSMYVAGSCLTAQDAT